MTLFFVFNPWQNSKMRKQYIYIKKIFSLQAAIFSITFNEYSMYIYLVPLFSKLMQRSHLGSKLLLFREQSQYLGEEQKKIWINKPSKVHNETSRFEDISFYYVIRFATFFEGGEGIYPSTFKLLVTNIAHVWWQSTPVFRKGRTRDVCSWHVAQYHVTGPENPYCYYFILPALWQPGALLNCLQVWLVFERVILITWTK